MLPACNQLGRLPKVAENEAFESALSDSINYTSSCLCEGVAVQTVKSGLGCQLVPPPVITFEVDIILVFRTEARGPSPRQSRRLSC